MHYVFNKINPLSHAHKFTYFAGTLPGLSAPGFFNQFVLIFFLFVSGT